MVKIPSIHYVTEKQYGRLLYIDKSIWPKEMINEFTFNGKNGSILYYLGKGPFEKLEEEEFILNMTQEQIEEISHYYGIPENLLLEWENNDSVFDAFRGYKKRISKRMKEKFHEFYATAKIIKNNPKNKSRLLEDVLDLEV
ncbi:hypothetical protein CL617_03090 [archaeon]|nr:hypothetical protein [archaeon]|tara:strand:+ start:23787 stop:24209 length:423 start_codon:yes stop_codon:yes gene_type:complete